MLNRIEIASSHAMTFFCVVVQMVELNQMGRRGIVCRLLNKVRGGFGGQCVSVRTADYLPESG